MKHSRRGVLFPALGLEDTSKIAAPKLVVIKIYCRRR